MNCVAGTREIIVDNFAGGGGAIHTRSPVMYDKPVPARGQQGLWNWESEGER